MPTTSHPSRLRLSCGAVLLGAFAWSLPALAQTAPGPSPAASPPPGQKPPCIPASSYVLGYDCELFPLPTLPTPAPAEAPAAVVAVVPVVPVAPGAEPPAAASIPAPAPTPPPTPAPPPAAQTSSSDNSPSHAPAYVAFALGAGGVGMTVAFGILALQTKSTLNGECMSGNCPASASSTVSKLNLYDDLADVGLGVAVAGVAVGAILFATERSSSSSSGARHIEPWIGLGAGGVKGTF